MKNYILESFFIFILFLWGCSVKNKNVIVESSNNLAKKFEISITDTSLIKAITYYIELDKNYSNSYFNNNVITVEVLNSFLYDQFLISSIPHKVHESYIKGDKYTFIKNHLVILENPILNYIDDDQSAFKQEIKRIDSLLISDNPQIISYDPLYIVYSHCKNIDIDTIEIYGDSMKQPSSELIDSVCKCKIDELILAKRKSGTHNIIKIGTQNKISPSSD